METKTSLNNEPPPAAKPPLSAVLDFGDYCTIEQHRYGCDNEHYIH